MSRYGRIERGYMAADHFTQVSNTLARDKRLSRKARGLFLEIASHRDGYGLTVEALVRSGPEGRDAIMTGLKELERYGYLERHQERDARGRLGTAVYRITDSPRRRASPPAGSNPRSGPSSENPTTGEPTSDEPTSGHTQPQKTKVKKTTRQQTTPSPPSRPSPPSHSGADARARENGTARTDGPAAAPSPGVSLLLEIGARDPRLGIGGQALARQGEYLNALLAAGWEAESLRTALTGGLPAHITRPAGFLARRISHIPAAPATLPAQVTRPQSAVTSTPPPFGQHLLTPPLPECEDCGVPPVPGFDRCAACMAWPYCADCQRRRVTPESTGLCRTCDEEHRQAPQTTPEARAHPARGES